MKKLLVALAVGVLLAVPSIVVLMAATGAGAVGVCGPAGPGQDVAGTKLDAEQLANAQTIVATVRALKLPPYAAVVAIAVAKTESDLRNDLVQQNLDSIGLFQQRVSVYTATVAADPVKATTAFLTRLAKVTNWATIPLRDAAQAVQISAFPDRYATWKDLAVAVVSKLWAGVGSVGCSGGVGDKAAGSGGGIPAGYQLPTSTQARTAVSFALAQLGDPYVFGANGLDAWDCSSLVQHAWAAAGVALPRGTFEQVKTGVPIVNLAAMQPGDLIFIPGSDGTTTNPGHVGMYIGVGGDGKQYLVQAPQSGEVVKISTVASWSGEVVAIRRPVSPA